MAFTNNVPRGEISHAKPPQAALWLGYAGVLTFVGCLRGMIIAPTPWSTFAKIGLLAYGACILSFLGGIHWGVAVTGTRETTTGPWRHLALAVLPALIGWIALLFGSQWGLELLICGFALALWGDVISQREGLSPGWSLRLRIPLSAIVIAILLLGAVIDRS